MCESTNTFMNDLIVIRERIKTNKSLVKTTRDYIEADVALIQQLCKHEGIIYYCEYKPAGILFDADSPMRMCSVCGQEEETWNKYKSKDNVTQLPSEYDEEVKLRTVKLDREVYYKIHNQLN